MGGDAFGTERKRLQTNNLSIDGINKKYICSIYGRICVCDRLVSIKTSADK